MAKRVWSEHDRFRRSESRLAGCCFTLKKPAETSLPHAATRALAATPSPMTSGTVACAQGLRGLGRPGVGEGGPAEVIRPRRPDKRKFRRQSSRAVRSDEVVWLQMQPRTLSG